MNEELLEQLEEWHEEDEFEEIVDAIMEIPEEERDYVLISHLGRAMNNLERYEEAVELFLSIQEEGKNDPLWHYRIGHAYYYLKRYEDARRAFEVADHLEPGDEDTLEFLEWIRKKTAPKPVKKRNAADPDVLKFWDDRALAADQYTLAPPSDDLIESVEEALVFKLPASYIQAMKLYNGGIPRNRKFPIGDGEEYIEISGILGIGRDKKKSLCGSLGSRYIIESGGYPEIGVVICDCPSPTEVVMLDYRSSGNDGEPEVVHVDKANDYKITHLANNFEAFMDGLTS